MVAKTTKTDSLAIKIAGPAGSGVIQAGELLSGALNLAGFFTLAYTEYQSRIRGGDNNVQIVASSKPSPAPQAKIDALFSLNKELADTHQKELRRADQSFDTESTGIDKLELVLKNPIVKNSALAGFIWKYLAQDLGVLQKEVRKTFKPAHLLLNLQAAELGYNLFDGPSLILKCSTKKIISLTGNEVLAMAAKKAGCEYASIYPMTPITGLIGHINELGIPYVVPEDEIFAALSCVGASHAGKRALTATSGGGFCLMTEAIGFSAMAEIPLVVILGQRPGPSSGMPTYGSQGDLDFAINGTHGEAPKIVLAPGNLEEVYTLTQEAFNLADQYQIPVIILTDKFLSESRFSTSRDLGEIKVKIDRGQRFKPSSKDYLRYKITPSGISPRAYPGETTFLTNSYEHDEYGFSADNAKMRRIMQEKRAHKLKNLAGGYETYGNKKSKNVIVGWGSTKTILEDYAQTHPVLKYVHISRVWPFPKKLAIEFKEAKKIICVENNSTGQMAQIIKSQTGFEPIRILKDDGRPFFQEELTAEIEKKI